MDALLEIGRIGKPHGLRGELAVDLTSTRADRLAAGSSLEARRLGSDATVPLVVVESRPHGGRHLVRFAGVDDRTAAERLVNATLLAVPEDSGDDLYVHELIGCAVVDQDGVSRGSVTSVEANPASDLLVLDSGALVPARFVVDHRDRTVYVEVPDGLFE